MLGHEYEVEISVAVRVSGTSPVRPPSRGEVECLVTGHTPSGAQWRTLT